MATKSSSSSYSNNKSTRRRRSSSIRRQQHHPQTTTAGSMSYAELLERQAVLQERLGHLTATSTAAVTATTVADEDDTAAAAAAATTAATTTRRRRTTTRGSSRQPTRSAAAAAAAAAEAMADTTETSTTTTPTTAARSVPVVVVPTIKKTDTHRDFVLKELQWLAADFTAERQRHTAASRKLATAVRLHTQQRETRLLRELQTAAAKRRKLASRISRQVVAGWWGKLNKVLAYQQKVSAEQARNAEMNAQLAELVQLTERYTQQLATTVTTTTTTSSNGRTITSGGGAFAQQQQQFWMIEQALAAAVTPRRSKQVVRDYARLQSTEAAGVLYGESTEDSTTGGGGAGGDSSDDDDDDESWHDHAHPQERDDETTLVQAELEELQERQQQRKRRFLFKTDAAAAAGGAVAKNDEDDDDTAIPSSTVSFQADPLELQLLQEEADMDMDQVLERILHQQEEGSTEGDDDDGGDSGDDSDENDDDDNDESTRQEQKGQQRKRAKRRVQFAPSPPPTQQQPDPGHDADDDADASDVEDFVVMEEDEDGLNGEEDDDDGSDDFILDQNNEQVDDETTIAQEEALPKEMSSAEEISLLQAEGEVSIKELRNRYAAILQQQEEEPGKEGSEDNGNGDDGEDDEVIEDVQEATDISLEQVEDQQRYNVAQLLSKNENDDQVEEEYQPETEEAIDDETTIAVEEKLGRDMSYEEEIAMLKRESEMSVEELRAMYAGMEHAGEGSDSDVIADDSGIVDELEKAVGDEENDDEFVPLQEEKDDETTMEAEERLVREISVEDELRLLKSEGALPIEQLRSMYNVVDERKREDLPNEQLRSMYNVGDESIHDSSTSANKRKREDHSDICQRKQSRMGKRSDAGKEALDVLEDSAEKAQQTKASRPFILSPSVKLREYQQTGLNWLVSMQTRRLNGILADGKKSLQCSWAKSSICDESVTCSCLITSTD